MTYDGSSSIPQFKSGESLAEWRCSELVRNPLTSPFWDSDDEDEVPKPCDLYGSHTWTIEKFSQCSSRVLLSDPFEVGGYKWHIAAYPQGCDVFNHFSLFLGVDDHEKLLPGWNHYAQFTITLVNKDSKKSKHSESFHRFWRKEFDWGWKKFLELSKVLEEFVYDDALIIRAQVQVLRARADRPFRCLCFEYRRELLQLHLTTVEQIFLRFVEERGGKLWKLIEDKTTWSSICSFWLSMDQSARHNMSRVKTDPMLKQVMKNFFIERDVRTTLVMESLYTGLKVLEGQSKHTEEAENQPVPFIRREEDVFVLVDDVLPLLETAAQKHEIGPQNHIKDESDDAGEELFTVTAERRLTELGRRAIEMIVVNHLIGEIEVACKEAFALKKQQELIQEEEEEAAEQKGKRGGGADKKKSKKKQVHRRRNI